MKLLYVDEPENDLEAIDFFIQEAAAVDEVDYGDCMREWNRELLYLKDHLKNPSQWSRQKIQQMQMYIQFIPNWDVPSTKTRILSDAHDLREHVALGENSGPAA